MRSTTLVFLFVMIPTSCKPRSNRSNVQADALSLGSSLLGDIYREELPICLVIDAKLFPNDPEQIKPETVAFRDQYERLFSRYLLQWLDELREFTADSQNPLPQHRLKFLYRSDGCKSVTACTATSVFNQPNNDVSLDINISLDEHQELSFGWGSTSRALCLSGLLKTSDNNWDDSVAAHELGHTLGLGHGGGSGGFETEIQHGVMRPGWVGTGFNGHLYPDDRLGIRSLYCFHFRGKNSELCSAFPNVGGKDVDKFGNPIRFGFAHDFELSLVEIEKTMQIAIDENYSKSKTNTFLLPQVLKLHDDGPGGFEVGDAIVKFDGYHFLSFRTEVKTADLHAKFQHRFDDELAVSSHVEATVIRKGRLIKMEVNAKTRGEAIPKATVPNLAPLTHTSIQVNDVVRLLQPFESTELGKIPKAIYFTVIEVTKDAARVQYFDRRGFIPFILLEKDMRPVGFFPK